MGLGSNFKTRGVHGNRPTRRHLIRLLRRSDAGSDLTNPTPAGQLSVFNFKTLAGQLWVGQKLDPPNPWIALVLVVSLFVLLGCEHHDVY